MATLNFTDTADFTALNNCSINNAVLPGYFNFNTDDTGTGLDDFTQTPGAAGGSITLTGGRVDILPPTSIQGMTIFSGGDVTDCPRITLNAGTSGNYKLRCRLFNMPTGLTPAAVGLYEDDLNHALDAHYYQTNWRLTGITRVDGSRTGFSGASIDATDIYFEHARSGDTFTMGAANSLSDLASQTGTYVAQTDQNAILADGNLCCVVDYESGTRQAVSFDDFTVVEGFTGTAQALIGDSGTGTGRYIDAGVGLTLDWSTFTPSLTNAAVTWDVECNETGVFDNTTYTYTAQSTAQVQALTDNCRYAQIRANLTSTGASPSLNSISIDNISSDITAPSAPTNAFAYKDTETTTLDAFLKWTNGADNVGGIGYAGTNIGYYDTSDTSWYYQQSDESFSTTETFANLNLLGTASTESLATLQNIPSTATQIRYTGWDLSGNNSTRTDVALVDIDSGIGGDSALLVIDKIAWGMDSNGDLVARPTPLDFNYPDEGDVRISRIFGYEDQYTGTANDLPSPDAPTITSITNNKDGTTATAVVDAPVGISVYVYAYRYFGAAPTKALVGSRVGPGSVTLTPSTTGNYIAVAVTLNGSYSLFSDPKPFIIGHERNYQMRDNAAKSAVHVLTHSHLGDEVIFKNGDSGEEFNLIVKINTGQGTVTLRNSVFTGEEPLSMTIPRQTGFPPGDNLNDLNPTATIEYDNILYEIDRIIPSEGVPKLSPEFTVNCSRSKSGTY